MLIRLSQTGAYMSSPACSYARLTRRVFAVTLFPWIAGVNRLAPRLNPLHVIGLAQGAVCDNRIGKNERQLSLSIQALLEGCSTR